MAQTESSTPVRRLTFQAVMTAVLDGAPISRADLSRLTGLSKQTISQVVRELEDDGWLRISGKTQGNLGRSAVTYELAGRRAHVLGIDLGGSKVHAALCDLDGQIADELIEETDRRGGLHVVEQMAAMACRLSSSAGARFELAGVGIPGAVDPEHGTITMVPNIAGFQELPLKELLQIRLGCDVVLDNDVNMAARGELWQGAASSADFAFVAMGTGIGLGLVSGGRVIRGVGGTAGEISHLPIGGDPFDARNFNYGTLEGAVRSVAIVERYEAYGGERGITVRDIFERIGDSDPIAKRTIDEIARLVAQLVLVLSAVTAPDVIVFGGSVGARPELIDRVTRHLAACMAVPVACEISSLGNRAAVIGGLAAARRRFLRRMFDGAGRVEASAPRIATENL